MSARSPLSKKKLYFGSILLVPLAIYLVRFHTIFVLLTLPFCLGSTFGMASILSRGWRGRKWTPVSKFEDWRQFSWADKLLTWIAIVAGILLLFCFGEVADCLRQEDVWKSGFIQLSPEFCEQIRDLISAHDD